MTRTLMWCALAVSLCAGGYAGVALATPDSGFSATTLALARFEAIDVKNVILPENAWQARLTTQGVSDVHVQSNLWAPGGTTGWHTHPGHSLILVTKGAITVYDGHDASCTPHVYTEGMGVVDHGGDHVHLIRNETGAEARTIAVQLTPVAAVRRIDAPAPGNCSF